MENIPVQHVGSVTCDAANSQQTAYLHDAGLSSAGASNCDPQQKPSISTDSRWKQDRPLQDAAFDRFYSLVEVCAAAGSPVESLNPTPPFNHSQSPTTSRSLPSLPYAMVRAPPSDAEDEPTSACSSHNVDTIERSRRRHPCKMCNKAFDRPSTLKTHLLVHTGITPFACHLCGRRFGVQSNCNRHIRRCTLRNELFLARRREFDSSQPGHVRPPTTQHLKELPPCSESSRSPSPPTLKPKRARRKRSPVPEWIPQSLISFKRPSTHTPTPVPLPPVRPHTAQEERDSYIICHERPYSEEGWNGKLPGPAPLYDSLTKPFSHLRRKNTTKT